MHSLPAPAEVIVFALPCCDPTAASLRPFLHGVQSWDIALLDLIVLIRGPNGATTFVGTDKAPDLAPVVETISANTPCLSMADVVSLSAAVEPGTTAAFVAFESDWHSSLEVLIKLTGGRVLTHASLPSHAVEAVLPVY
jgi:hypothetical protein